MVNLPEFEMARFPVTNMEYSQFVWDSGYKAPRGWIGLHYSSDQDTRWWAFHAEMPWPTLNG